MVSDRERSIYALLELSQTHHIEGFARDSVSSLLTFFGVPRSHNNVSYRFESQLHSLTAGTSNGNGRVA